LDYTITHFGRRDRDFCSRAEYIASDLVQRIIHWMDPETNALLDRISGDEFQFALRGWKEPSARFYGPSSAMGEILAEREHWLRTNPERHLVFTPEAKNLVEEAAGLAHHWDGAFRPAPGMSAEEMLVNLGLHWEADFILCRMEPEGTFSMQAAVVCFPSHWSPEEKIGLGMAQVHGPVPGLNAALGGKIDTLMGRLPAGSAWLRVNWGLTASAERNQHPLRKLPRLSRDTPIEAIWLRMEHQSLVRLPSSGGILFGIRLVNLPLASLHEHPAAAKAIAGQLRSMPESVRMYKGIKETASRIFGWLESVT